MVLSIRQNQIYAELDLPYISLGQLQALAQELGCAKESKPLLDVKSPTSIAELSAMFSPHEEKMLRFLKGVNNGAYSRWGFESRSPDRPMD